MPPRNQLQARVEKVGNQHRDVDAAPLIATLAVNQLTNQRNHMPKRRVLARLRNHMCGLLHTRATTTSRHPLQQRKFDGVKRRPKCIVGLHSRLRSDTKAPLPCAGLEADALLGSFAAQVNDAINA